MASAKQIAANKRNAARSTGPRSSSGKKRVSRNAYRHGLSQSVTSLRELQEELDERALELAQGSRDPLTLENARRVAEAELDVWRARWAKTGFIARTFVFGRVDLPPFTTPRMIRWLKAFERGIELPFTDAMEHVPPMPDEASHRTAEAIRRALPELLKMDRYERRAAGRRDRAVRELCRTRARLGRPGSWQNKPKFC